MKTLIISVLAAIIAFSHVAFAGSETYHRKFDELHERNWEETMARLDNYVLQLQQESAFPFAVIVFHNSRHGRRSQLLDWATCIHDYLVNRRGFSSDRVVVMEGKPWKAITVELWLSVEKGLSDPDLKILKLRKRKAETWRRLCNI